MATNRYYIYVVMVTPIHGTRYLCCYGDAYSIIRATMALGICVVMVTPILLLLL